MAARLPSSLPLGISTLGRLQGTRAALTKNMGREEPDGPISDSGTAVHSGFLILLNRAFEARAEMQPRLQVACSWTNTGTHQEAELGTPQDSFEQKKKMGIS